MHENLKYHISLSKEVSEFDGFLDENPRTNRDYRNSLSGWDPIYAATHYGTEYFIYAKFIGSYSEGKKNIEKIQLYLQNYSGAVTLGFQGTAKLIRRKMEENDPDINLEKNPNNIKYNLVVVLEAFNYQKYSTEITIFQDGSPVIEEGELMEVTPVFYPALIERSKIFTPDKEKKNSDYADEQFMIRVGDDVVLSDEGIATLKKLYTLNLVTKDQLEAAGVVLDEFNTDGILEKEDFGDSDIDILIRKIDSSKAAKGIRFRCQPVNSIFTK